MKKIRLLLLTLIAAFALPLITKILALSFLISIIPPKKHKKDVT